MGVEEFRVVRLNDRTFLVLTPSGEVKRVTSRKELAEMTRPRAKERRCGHEGCETILSSYNTATRCWTHLHERDPVSERR